MYCALPSSLQSLLNLADHPSGEEAFVLRFLNEFIKGLSVLGVPSHTLLGLRRHLQLVGSVDEAADEGVSSLESLLRRHDLVLGPQMGGFANLFKSAVDEGDVFSDDVIDFAGLDEATKLRLQPVGDAADELTALDDVLDALSSRADRVTACIFLDHVTEWLNEGVVINWMTERPYLQETLRLYEHRDHLQQLSADFVQRILLGADLKDFALWFLARFVAGKIALQPLERRFVDTLLKKVELGSLATFERALFLN